MMTWLKSAPPWCLAAAVLLAAGCGSAHKTVTPAPAAAAAVTGASKQADLAAVPADDLGQRRMGAVLPRECRGSVG